MRKAQSISINTIIVAAIALVVLVVIIFIFSQKSSNFFEASGSCDAVSGSCETESHENKECKFPDWIPHPSAKCNKEDTIKCCIRIIPKPKKTT